MNTPRLSLLVVGVLLLLALTGCGSSGPATCQSICDQQGAAGCQATGCVTQCENTTTLTARTGCSAQNTALINCISTNVCSSATACSSQIAALSACGTAYCMTNPTDMSCVPTP